MKVTLRLWAAARTAAGRAEETYDDVTTLAGLLDAARERHAGDDLPRVLARCSYLVDEVSPGTRPHASVVLQDGSVVEALPPFAGGAGTRPGAAGAGTRLAPGGFGRS